ncbi:hypothetical protein AB0I60_27160 [Actinosynnema sp. NPDC050436]|uniref:hypothetical protein n=1 Tax=Actinosynnema sp. NPDC050436 TaxID=3155659 RepID=UPI0033E02AD3
MVSRVVVVGAAVRGHPQEMRLTMLWLQALTKLTMLMAVLQGQLSKPGAPLSVSRSSASDTIA